MSGDKMKDRMKEHEDFVKRKPNRNIWITIKANKVIGDYLIEYCEYYGKKRVAAVIATVSTLSKTQYELTKEFFWAGVCAGLLHPDDFILTLKDEKGKPITVRR